MSLSPENRALVERSIALPSISTVGGSLHLHSWETLNRLLNAAREEGLERGRDEAAELAAGEDI